MAVICTGQVAGTDVQLKLHRGFRRWVLNYCRCEEVNCDKKLGILEYPGFVVTIRCQQGSLGLVRSAVHVRERMWKSSFKWAISNINLIGETFFVPLGQGVTAQGQSIPPDRVGMEFEFSRLPVDPVHVAGFGGRDFDILQLTVVCELESF